MLKKGKLLCLVLSAILGLTPVTAYAGTYTVEKEQKQESLNNLGQSGEKKFIFTDVSAASGNWKYESVKYVLMYHTLVTKSTLALLTTQQASKSKRGGVEAKEETLVREPAD